MFIFERLKLYGDVDDEIESKILKRFSNAQDQLGSCVRTLVLAPGDSDTDDVERLGPLVAKGLKSSWRIKILKLVNTVGT